jgi:hypothetical protein
MSALTDNERVAARMKSYTGSAVLVFFLYWLFWFPGLIVNYVYLNEAKRMEKVAGQSLPGTGCLIAMLWLNIIGFVIGVLGICAYFTIGLSAFYLLGPTMKTPTPFSTQISRPVPTLAQLSVPTLPQLFRPTLTPPPNIPGYLRSNPVPLGKSVLWTGRNDEQIKFTLLQFYRGQNAWSRIKAANQFNNPPPSGAEYLLFKVRADFVKAGKEPSTTLGDAFFVIVTSDGQEYKSFKGPTIVPPDPQFIGTIYVNGSLEGWMAFTITAGDSHPLLAYGQAIFPNEMRVWLDTR